MTIEELGTTLNSITGFTGKVAYNAFPEKKAPSMPYICFMVEDYEIIYADNKPYYTSGTATVELYTNYRDVDTEGKVEAALVSAGLSYDKRIDYIDDEKCYMVSYTMSL